MLRRFGRLRMPPTADWMPQFCQPATVYSAMLLAEIVVVIAVLSPGESTTSWWRALGTGTVLAQWIALSTTAVLCLLRSRLIGLPSGAALATVTAVLVLTAWLMASLGFMLDRELEWGFLSAQQDRDRFVFGVVATVVVMAALGLRYGYVHVQWRLQIEARARTQVEALTARIRPHFLFNSMNTIAGLIHEDADIAERVIEDLSDLFRAALAAGEREHPLGRELELCRRYLAIEGLRLGERLRVAWDADAAPMDLPVPPLLLQPLVENAVYHGIQPLPDGGVVRVAAACIGDHLVLTIENPRPLQASARATGHGVAQENVRQRLHYAYAERASLEVEERAGYYGITLRLPLLALRES
jgi:two-component system sensor histidine kinase AlgZ